MPKIPGPFSVRCRPDVATWQVSLDPSCGLPRETCQKWQRKSFASLPDELARWRSPENETQAKRAALVLIG